MLYPKSKSPTKRKLIKSQALRLGLAAIPFALVFTCWRSSVGNPKAQTPVAERVSDAPIIYVVKNGDTLDSIAKHYKVTTKAIRELNQKTLERFEIQDLPGNQNLWPQLFGEPLFLQIKRKQRIVSQTYMTSDEGETLASIAESTKVRLTELKKANTRIKVNGRNLSSFDENTPLPSYQLLEIPAGGVVDPLPLASVVSHQKAGNFLVTQAAPGENLQQVAMSLNQAGLRTNASDLAYRNGLSANGQVDSGRAIVVGSGGNGRIIAKDAIVKQSVRVKAMPLNDCEGTDQLAAGKNVWVTFDSATFSQVLYYAPNKRYYTGWVYTNTLQLTGDFSDVAKQIGYIRNRMSDDSTSVNSAGQNPPTGNDGGTDTGGRMTVIGAARRFLGVPYVWGGVRANGTDCSGLVLQSFRQVGRCTLPRVSRDQWKRGQLVAVNQLKAGDRLYFSASGRRIDHTGLYAGNGHIIEANGHYRKVIERNLFTCSMFKHMYVGARRGGES